MSIITNFFKESISLWLEVSPYLLLGMTFAGLLHVLIGKAFISRQLGKGGLSSIVKATAIGVPLPVCSCGVIPLAASLRKDGAHKSSVLSFLVSTPTTGVDSIFATYSLMGPLFAIFRPLGALIAGIFLGSLDYIVEGRKEKPAVIPEHAHHKMKPSHRVREFFRYSFREIPEDIGMWLIIGTLLGGAIAAFIPKEIFSQYVFFPFDFLIALVIGIPLYVCATGSIPIAASLIAKGFSPGAALVFLIAGPATNAITLSFVRVKLGKKSFNLYLLSIILVSLLLGLLFNFVWVKLGANPNLIMGAGQMIPFSVKAVCAFILLGLIAPSLFKRKTHAIPQGIEVEVPDIHCAHCKVVLEASLAELEGVEEVFVDVAKKKVHLSGAADRKNIIDKIKKAGYHPKDT